MWGAALVAQGEAGPGAGAGPGPPRSPDGLLHNRHPGHGPRLVAPWQSQGAHIPGLHKAPFAASGVHQGRRPR